MEGLTPAATSQDFFSHHAAASPHPYMSGAPADPAVVPRPDGDERQTAKAKPRALVVDDAPDVTEMLAMLLRYAGYDVVTVFCAPDAYETALSEQFDVVVSDIGMPGMNGYELAERLRGLPDYEAVPLIAVTGFAMYDDRERATHAGFDAFLTKPINPSDLINLVKRLSDG